MTWTTLYRFFDSADQLLYVGISATPLQRWGQHRQNKPWWVDIARVTTQHFETRQEARVAETAAIESEHPLYNIQGATPAGWALAVRLEPTLQQYRDAADLPGQSGVESIYHAADFVEKLKRIVGWDRGFGWAYTEIGFSPTCLGFIGREDEAGRGWLFTSEAYDVVTDHLDAVCWRSAARRAA